MVGLAFWEDPKNGASQITDVIKSDNAQNLHGTVYFRQGALTIGGHRAVIAHFWRRRPD